jgi:hypothetical protein
MKLDSTYVKQHDSSFDKTQCERGTRTGRMFDICAGVCTAHLHEAALTSWWGQITIHSIFGMNPSRSSSILELLDSFARSVALCLLSFLFVSI